MSFLIMKKKKKNNQTIELKVKLNLRMSEFFHVNFLQCTIVQLLWRANLLSFLSLAVHQQKKRKD